MKKLTLLLHKLTAKQTLRTWLIFHFGFVVFFFITLITCKGKIRIDSDLFNLIPKSLAMDSVQKADEKMTSITGQNVFILVENPEFSVAKQIAVNVYEKLLESEYFESVVLYNNTNSISDVTDFLYKYRWNMLDEKTASFVQNGGAQEFAFNALAQAYGGFTMLPLDNLETDPFMLTEYSLGNYLNALQKSGTAMGVKDGVLASENEGNWYIMIRGVLNDKGATLAAKSNGVTEIYSTCNQVAAELGAGEETKFIYSGTPFHSHQSSTSAAREIKTISIISMLIVILLLIVVFKSVKPLVLSVGSILISVTTAFLATLAVFKNMHVITLVFGTSLIGSCIDYSLHYFIHWAGNKELKSGEEIRNHIMPGLTMAIISSSICFAILIFAPFMLLKQMSLFCLVGLLSSYFTTVAIYPRIKLPEGERQLSQVKTFSKITYKLQNPIVGKIVIASIFAFSICTIFICREKVSVKNNLLTLYKMEGKLLSDEIEANKIIQYSPSGWYMISGKTVEECLTNEENFRTQFEQHFDNKLGYVCTSLFVPSVKRQENSREASKVLLELAAEQFDALGFEPECSEELIKDFEKEEYISFEKENVPTYLLSSISSFWLGKVGDKYYSVLLPNKVDDYDKFKSLAENNDDVYFISKSADISRDLDKLTLMILSFFIVAYILMFIMLKFFYNWQQSLKIISVPFLIILVTVAVFALAGINLEFFSVTGLILVFGLGLDYIIYMIENEKQKESEEKVLEPFATALSFITTIISFGALALSSFQPVHLIGLSIVIGLTTAYVSSFFYARRKSEK